MIDQVIKNAEFQKKFFMSGQTRDMTFRIGQLKKLKKAIRLYEDRLYDALWKDLHKSKFEAYATEIGIVLAEISSHIRKLSGWVRPQRVPTNEIIHFWSTSKIIKEPYGQVLIIAPWNYPFLLLVNPLIGAISAGNCVALKASEYTPNTARIMGEMIAEFFPQDYISFYSGGRESNQALLAQKWDYIFFTGSTAVGKVVMEAASKTLTPVTLELGGKSPCIVDKDANLKIAAARIVWGKFINAGQTCIAPDYLFVHQSVKTQLLELMKERIVHYFGKDPEKSNDYPRIATVQKTQRLAAFLQKGNVITGGEVKVQERYISPTIMDGILPDYPIMREEIFGPILPVMEFSELKEVIEYVNSQPKPLAFYYFSEDTRKQHEILLRTSSGGACINEVVMHIANENLPFGGVGNSGIGRYHGIYSFDTFSHHRSVLKKATWIDIPIRYPPYRLKHKLLKLILR